MATRKRTPSRRSSPRKPSQPKKKPSRAPLSARTKAGAGQKRVSGKPARKTRRTAARMGKAPAPARGQRAGVKQAHPARGAIRVDKTELTEPTGTTPRAVRRSRLVSGATADMYIASQRPSLQPILERLRALILEHAPQLTETIQWGQPTYSHEQVGNVLGLMAFQGHVNLVFFHGTHLTDADGRLTGTGKGMRHASFHPLDDVRDERVVPLIREAVADLR